MQSNISDEVFSICNCETNEEILDHDEEVESENKDKESGTLHDDTTKDEIKQSNPKGKLIFLFRKYVACLFLIRAQSFGF